MKRSIMNEDMKITEQILREENSFIKSEIDGVSDLIWSIGARCIYPGGEALVKWFGLPVPAFANRAPIDILREDGEEVLFQYMKSLPC